MSWLGKLVGGAFGFMLGGPLGAIFGASVGHQFDAGMDGMAGESFNRLLILSPPQAALIR